MDREDGEVIMRQKIMETFKPKDTNVEILALIAKELDAGRRDTRYKAPFSIPDRDITSEPDVESDVLIVDSEEERTV
jgi:hypothetical protein